jgi:uncharacterized protein (TIGR03435 family)
MTATPRGTVPCGLNSSVQDGMWRYYFGGRTIESIRILAQNTLGHRVNNGTGLSGAYDIELSWRVSPDDLDGPSFESAIKDQLGLRLQPAKVEVETLVIDHIERPTQN